MNKKKALAFFVGLPLAAVCLFVYWYTITHAPIQAESNLKTLMVGTSTVYVSIADTEASREKGLGGRTSLAGNEGMLFVFPNEGFYSFWMKGMRFSIDILWIATDGEIVYIVPAVSPATYPKAFVSKKPARYVLELPEEYASQHQIRVGSKVGI